MANALYAKGKQNLLSGNFNISSGGNTVKTHLSDHGGDTPNVSTDDAQDDISAGVVGTNQTIASPTVTDGVYDAADVTYTSLSGNSVESITIFKDTGTPSTSFLLVYLDTGTNLTGGFTPNGGNVTIQWNGSGIFAL